MEKKNYLIQKQKFNSNSEAPYGSTMDYIYGKYKLFQEIYLKQCSILRRSIDARTRTDKKQIQIMPRPFS